MCCFCALQMYSSTFEMCIASISEEIEASKEVEPYCEHVIHVGSHHCLLWHMAGEMLSWSWKYLLMCWLLLYKGTDLIILVLNWHTFIYLFILLISDWVTSIMGGKKKSTHKHTHKKNKTKHWITSWVYKLNIRILGNARIQIFIWIRCSWL